jgi:hypothetical protein
MSLKWLDSKEEIPELRTLPEELLCSTDRKLQEEDLGLARVFLDLSWMKSLVIQIVFLSPRKGLFSYLCFTLNYIAPDESY